jgi:hypothetical protein
MKSNLQGRRDDRKGSFSPPLNTARLYGKMPKEFLLDREQLILRLWRSPEMWKLAPELPY